MGSVSESGGAMAGVAYRGIVACFFPRYCDVGSLVFTQFPVLASIFADWFFVGSEGNRICFRLRQDSGSGSGYRSGGGGMPASGGVSARLGRPVYETFTHYY